MAFHRKFHLSKALVVCFLFMHGAALLAQGGWTDDGTKVRLTTATDKVGIGTPNPTNALSFGTNSIISTATSDASDNDWLRLAGGGTASNSRGAVIALYGNEHANTGHLVLNPGIHASGQVQIDNTVNIGAGKVGIGTSSPQSLLAVNGTITAK